MFFKVNLIDYIPEFLHEVREFQLIMESESIELDKLTEGMKANLENSIISSMDEYSVLRYEKFLGVVGEGTLEQRRKYLITLITTNDKLSEKTIKAIVKTIMNSDCYVDFFAGEDFQNPQPGQGFLRIRVLAPDASSADPRFEDVARAILPLMPAHIQMKVQKFFSTWGDVALGHLDWESISNNFSTWGDLKNYLPPLV